MNLDPAVEVTALPGWGPWWHARVWRDLRARPAIWISTSLIVSQLPGVRALPAVLDVTTFLYPELHTRRTRLAERLLLPRALRRWPAVTCTAVTAADLEHRFGPGTVSARRPAGAPRADHRPRARRRPPIRPPCRHARAAKEHRDRTARRPAGPG